MINCSLIKDLLPLYDEDTVSPESREIIQEHLANCPECREYYARIRRMPHAYQEECSINNYHYSELVRSMHRRAIMEYAAGAVLLTAASVGLVKTLCDLRRK